MIYVASRASVPKYPAEWRRLRSQGWPINSSWIDEAGEGETACMSELWQRIETEVRAATGLILWAEEEDFPLKGAYVEVGMALAMGKRVGVYTKVPFGNTQYRPFGSWMNHPLVRRCFSLDSARQWAMSAHGVGGTPLAADSDPEKRPDFYTWTWDVEIGGGRWEARYGWKKPDGKAHNLKPLFTHGAGGKSNG